MTWMTRICQRGTWLLTILLLVLLLAFAGCGAARQGATGNPATNQSTQQNQSGDSMQQGTSAQDDDSDTIQIQNLSKSADDAQNDANATDNGMDNEQIP